MQTSNELRSELSVNSDRLKRDMYREDKWSASFSRSLDNLFNAAPQLKAPNELEVVDEQVRASKIDSFVEAFEIPARRASATPTSIISNSKVTLSTGHLKSVDVAADARQATGVANRLNNTVPVETPILEPQVIAGIEDAVCEDDSKVSALPLLPVSRIFDANPPFRLFRGPEGNIIEINFNFRTSHPNFNVAEFLTLVKQQMNNIAVVQLGNDVLWRADVRKLSDNGFFLSL